MIETLKVPEHAGTMDPFDPGKLQAIVTWAGAGFALLSAALTFIGTTGGYLQRILGEHQVQSMWVFVLIGLGVVTSLFAGAIKADYLVYWLWILVAIAFIGGLSAAFFADFGVSGFGTPFLSSLLAITAILAAYLYVKASTVALAAGLLVVAVAATSLGLYGAVKLSIGSQAAPEPLLTQPELVKSGGRDAVKVTLAGSQQTAPVGTVAVYIIGDKKNEAGKYPSRKAGWANFHPDTSNKVKESFKFPVSLANAREVSVRSCMGLKCELTEQTETWRVKVFPSKSK